MIFQRIYWQRIYWRDKRFWAEQAVQSVEHDLKFCTPFFLGSLYEREKNRLIKKLSIAKSDLEVADKKCLELGVEK